MTSPPPASVATPDSNAPTNDGGRRVLRRAFRVAAPQQAVALTAGFAWRAAAIGTPWAIQKAIDDGIIADDTDALRRWCLVLVGLGAVLWVGDAVRHLFADRAGYTAMIDVRRRTLTALLDADTDAAGRYAPGEIISRLAADCGRIRMWVTASITGVIAGATLIAVIVLVAALDPWLAAIALAVVPLSGLLAVTRNTPNLAASTESMEASGRTSAWIEASVSGIETVKGLGAEPVVIARTRDRVAVSRDRAYALAVLQARWYATANAIPGFGIALGLLVGGTRAIDGSISAGELLAFSGWMGLLAGATTTLTSRLGMRGVALASAKRLSEIEHLPAHPAGGGAEPDPGGAAGAVSVERVAIDRGDLSILTGVSFAAAPGTWTAVVGATGSGKSSLLQAIAGDLRVTSGEVTIDGVDLAALRRPTRSGLVSLVPQNPTIVNGSIADILRRVAPAASDADLHRVLDVCQLGAFVAELGGLDGRIGERGRTVSGGQRQRFALATALLRRSPVLLLDDVTSALDEDVEAALLDALRTETAGSTVVFATHRPAPMRRADAVIDLTPHARNTTTEPIP
ncbi:MAG: ABC transporter ATP-binding protein [Actinomycetota bacterium]